MPPTTSTDWFISSLRICCTTAGRLFLGIWCTLLGSLFLMQSLVHAQTSESEFKLGWPIDCTPGLDCHVLAYVDKLSGPEFQDVGGGRQTYDGHDGTDFGIANESLMKKGITVKAAAAGTVVRVRDGVADKRVQSNLEAQAINHIGCGNAVVIDHPNDWRTVYCHLRKGSLTVKEGMQVAKGSQLGLVGLSGLTSYPHVHFGVRHRGLTIDPYAGSPAVQIDPEHLRPLWDIPTPYTATGLIDSGFSSQRPHIDTVWQRSESVQSITNRSAALYFWVHPFGVLGGDIEQFRLIDPTGSPAVEQNRVIAKANRINWLSVIAEQSTPEKPLRVGIWQGHYQLRRGSKLLIDVRREIEVKAP